MDPPESSFSRPPEWSDEDRMYYLLAPFPPNTRPSVSDSKVAFWRSLIKSSSRELRRWVFTERDLIDRFKYKGSEARCLKVVLECLEAVGEARKLSSYRGEEGGGWVNWGVKVLSSPVSWAWKYVSSKDEEEFTLAGVAKELIELVLTEHYKTVTSPVVDCVMSIGQFEELCKKSLGKALSKDYRLVELQMLEDGKMSKYRSSEDDVVVKFASSRSQRVATATEVDMGILRIKQTIASLQERVDQKTNICASLKARALQCFRANQKTEATRLLRQLKMEQKTQMTLAQQLENLTGAFSQIQMAETNAKVFKAYESSLSVLRSIREGGDVTVEKVEDVMDEMHQLVREGDDVTNVLAQDLDDGSTVDEDELIKELEALGLEDYKPAHVPEKHITTVPATGMPGKHTTTPITIPGTTEREKLSKPDKVKRPVLLS